MNNDLISRSELKKALKSNCDTLCNDKNTNWCEHCCPLNDFEDLIDNAPTVTPELPTEVKKAIEVSKVMKQGKWVPVSEKLPPNYILCLFCDKDGNIFYGHRKTNNLWYEEFQTGNVSDVVAWQELPEPYKEGGAE